MHCIYDVHLFPDILHSVRSKVHSTGAIMHCIHSKILYLYISAIVQYLVQHVLTLCIISIVIALLLVLQYTVHTTSNINLLKTLFTKGVLRLHGAQWFTFRTTKCASGRSLYYKTFPPLYIIAIANIYRELLLLWVDKLNMHILS